MRFLAIVSIFFAVTQVAFAAPVSRAFRSDVITRNLQPPHRQERRGFFKKLQQTHKNFLHGVKAGLKHGTNTFSNAQQQSKQSKQSKQPTVIEVHHIHVHTIVPSKKPEDEESEPEESESEESKPEESEPEEPESKQPPKVIVHHHVHTFAEPPEKGPEFPTAHPAPPPKPPV
ncbi:hypothetical protein K439DRAFT_1633636 [Ramaria rubella]|nr:hypothetical protein K439DRAFT_1633636 [Ramaria rubella]